MLKCSLSVACLMILINLLSVLNLLIHKTQVTLWFFLTVVTTFVFWPLVLRCRMYSSVQIHQLVQLKTQMSQCDLCVYTGIVSCCIAWIYKQKKFYVGICNLNLQMGIPFHYWNNGNTCQFHEHFCVSFTSI